MWGGGEGVSGEASEELAEAVVGALSMIPALPTVRLAAQLISLCGLPANHGENRTARDLHYTRKLAGETRSFRSFAGLVYAWCFGSARSCVLWGAGLVQATPEERWQK